MINGHGWHRCSVAVLQEGGATNARTGELACKNALNRINITIQHTKTQLNR